jgi:hypothetical protein
MLSSRCWLTASGPKYVVRKNKTMSQAQQKDPRKDFESELPGIVEGTKGSLTTSVL